MKLKHVAIVCRSEETCDRFYRDLLGLSKTGGKTVPADLAQQIFNVDRPYRIINYADERLHFEIFLDPTAAYDDRKAVHICLAVPDPDLLCVRAEALGVAVQRIAAAGRQLTFIRDLDGNLFEIKPDTPPSAAP